MRSILASALLGLLLLTSAAYAAEPTVAELIATVKSSDEPARLVAIDSLALLGAKAGDAVPALRAALKDPSAAVRAHAAQALGAIGEAAKPAVEDLAALVADPDKAVRREAIEAIGWIHPGPKVGIPLFTKLMDSSDPQARQAALNTLADQGKAAVPFLTEALSHEKATYWACLVLGRIGPDAKDAVPALTQLIDDKRPEVRREAILALVAIGDLAAAMPKIEKGLDDPHVKTAAIFAAGQTRKASAEAEAKIRKQVDNSDPVLSTVSVWALARLHPDDKALVANATDRLLAGLKSKEPRARKAAARALGSLELGPDVVVPAMEKAFQGANEETVREALEALNSLGPAAVPKLIDALKFESVRPFVVNMLGQQGAAAKPAVDALVKLLDDKNRDVQREVVMALGHIGPDAKAAVPALTKRLADCMTREGNECYGVAFALGRIASPEAVPALMKALASQDESLAMISAWALVQIQPKDAATAAKTVPLLTQALSDTEPKFRRGAAEALKQLGPLAKSALTELEKAAKDEDAAVRSAAAEAIKAVGG